MKKNETCKFCGKVHEWKHCPYYNEGTNKEIAFIFSCPGNAEKEHSYPISGETGKTFDVLLGILKEKNIIKSYQCRYDFRITNATTNIESRSETKKTEATNPEVKKEENRKRLLGEIKGFDKIICFGKTAVLDFSVK